MKVPFCNFEFEAIGRIFEELENTLNIGKDLLGPAYYSVQPSSALDGPVLQGSSQAMVHWPNFLPREADCARAMRHCPTTLETKVAAIPLGPCSRHPTCLPPPYPLQESYIKDNSPFTFSSSCSPSPLLVHRASPPRASESSIPEPPSSCACTTSKQEPRL
jgi:hypothetical protein